MNNHQKLSDNANIKTLLNNYGVTFDHVYIFKKLTGWDKNGKIFHVTVKFRYREEGKNIKAILYKEFPWFYNFVVYTYGSDFINKIVEFIDREGRHN